MYLVRAHSKRSLLKFTPQVSSPQFASLLKFTPTFETVIDGRSHIYVFSERPFEMVTVTFRLSFRVNLTAHVYPPFETVIDGRSHIYVFSESPFKTVTITCKFTARPESPSSLLPDQSHLQVYCQSHLQVYPPFETVTDGT